MLRRLNFSGLELEPSYPVVLGRVLEDSPAETAGLRPGDRITAVNGQLVEHWPAFVSGRPPPGNPHP